MKKFDTNKDGKIVFDEFYSTMKPSQKEIF